jgi:predicted KAP-like P-loop ATPase
MSCSARHPYPEDIAAEAVDRLRPQEVLDIVRLVRLVGDFPNTLYLLAFDRGRVEECLGESNIERGRAYLEKIVQVTHDVPAETSAPTWLMPPSRQL